MTAFETEAQVSSEDVEIICVKSTALKILSDFNTIFSRPTEKGTLDHYCMNYSKLLGYVPPVSYCKLYSKSLTVCGNRNTFQSLSFCLQMLFMGNPIQRFLVVCFLFHQKQICKTFACQQKNSTHQAKQNVYTQIHNFYK